MKTKKVYSVCTSKGRFLYISESKINSKQNDIDMKDTIKSLGFDLDDITIKYDSKFILDYEERWEHKDLIKELEKEYIERKNNK